MKLQAEGPNVIASRKASQMAIEAFAPLLPELVGGSADLAHSNLTLWKGEQIGGPATDPDANYIYFGVREFAHDRDQRTASPCTAASFPTTRPSWCFQRLRAQRACA